MKLRNLLFGTMIACAFVACSNDDDPVDNGGGNENPTGKTLLQVKSNAVETKAEIAGSDFRVYVIDANGDIVADGPANEAFELTDPRAEGNVDIVVLKNMPVKEKPMKRADLFGVIDFSEKEESDEGNGQDMSQNTAVYRVTIERGKKNKLGYALSNNDNNVNDLLASETDPIPAFRNAAQIRLTSIKLDIEKVSKKYTDASLDIKDVMILNARKSSKMAADDTKIWAKTEKTDSPFLIGVDVEEYNKWVTGANDKENKYFTDIKTIRETYYNSNWYQGEVATYYGYGYKRDDINKTTKGTIKTEISAKDGENYLSVYPVVGKFFVYENTSKEDPTLLVVKADFKYKKSDGSDGVMKDRYYTVVLGKDLTQGSKFDFGAFGIKSVDDVEGIRRNILYSVSMTVTGPGSDNPLYPGSEEDGSLDVAVELQDYGWVNQDTEID